MATRNLTMVVPIEFYHGNKPNHPDMFKDVSRVNMYLHHDGYPQWQGVQLANWLKVNARQDSSALAAKLVKDMYYDSCYLYQNHQVIDHQYTYIIFADKEPLILCYDQYSSEEIFCYTPQEILNKYTDDMDYTDFAGGETRCEYSGLRSTKSYTD